MKHLFFVLLTLIALSGIGWWMLSTPPRPIHTLSGTNIIAFGDSLIVGVGATTGNDLVSQLSKIIDTPILNKGVGGDTTESALRRLDRDILQHDPRIVIVLLGGNDFIRRIPKEETFQNLVTVIESIEDAGAVVVLLGVRGGVLGDGYKREFEKLARQYDLYYVPNVLSGIIGNSKLLSDTIHPNDAGYRVIAERVGPILLEILGK